MNYRYYKLLAFIVMNAELQAISWSNLSRLFQLQQQSSLEIKEYKPDEHYDQVKALFDKVSYAKTLLHYKPFIDVPRCIEEIKKSPLTPWQMKEEEIQNLLEAETVRKKIVCTTTQNPQKVIGFAVYFRKIISCGMYDPKTKQIHQENQPMMYLDGMVVDPQEQRKGVGKHMVKYIENQALKSNVNSVIADVYPENYKAFKAFNKMGYRPIPNDMDIDTIQILKELKNLN